MDKNFAAYIVCTNGSVDEVISYLNYNDYKNVVHAFDDFYYCTELGDELDDVVVVENLEEFVASRKGVESYLIKARSTATTEIVIWLESLGYVNVKHKFSDYYTCTKLGVKNDNVFVVDKFYDNNDCSSSMCETSMYEQSMSVLNSVMDYVYDARSGSTVDFESNDMNSICDKYSSLF